MKQWIYKNICWLICTIILATVAVYGCFQTEEEALYFHLESSGKTETISVYEAREDYWYVFLPSHGKMERLKTGIAFGKTVSLGGIDLSDGMNCDVFELETEYDVTVNGRFTAKLQFLCSANISTMYINTASASMDSIHAKKDREETATVVLYKEDGSIEYHNEACTIKGRGNATWLNEKKPYLLKLPKDEDLLGMGAASKWVLLANAADESNLRNKLVLDLAAQTGVKWAPDCIYVDVYLNGHYNGLYLLTEKVETGSSRLDINTEAGDFLCKIDLDDRWDILSNPFQTEIGRTVEISEPKDVTQEEKARIKLLVDHMERTIVSGRGTKTLAPNIDVDSWIRKYLIDEISANIDADLASSYFYYTDGIFYAGPVWDYDMTFGNGYRNKDPQAFVAKNAVKAPAYRSPYYDAFYKNAAFYQRMTELYEEEFWPVLERLMDTEITQLSKSIAAATKMNSLRWEGMFQELYESEAVIQTTAESLTAYLQQRVSFLNEVWIDNVEYCMVQYEVPTRESYGNSCVKAGSVFSMLPDADNHVWIVEKTGEVFDPAEPVTEDMFLKLQQTQHTKDATDTNMESVPVENMASEKKVNIRTAAMILGVMIMAALFLSLIMIDYFRNCRKKKKTDEYLETHISP